MSKVSHNAQGRLYWPEATSIDRNSRLYREYYMTLSVSHPVSTRDANIGRYWSRVDTGCDAERAISYFIT
jgi:hypothetical protein